MSPPDYVDIQWASVALRAYSNQAECIWAWTGGGVAAVQQLAAPSDAAVTFTGTGEGSVQADCNCSDVWTFKALDMAIDIESIAFVIPDGPNPPSKVVWVNSDDDNDADGAYGVANAVYGRPDMTLQSTDGSAVSISNEDDLVTLNLSPITGAEGANFTQPKWSLWYPQEKLRIWYPLSSNGNLYDHASGAPWLNPVDKVFNGDTYRLFPAGQWIDGMPEDRHFKIEGVFPTAAGEEPITYGFSALYTHSETNLETPFEMWRTARATVVGLFVWGDNVSMQPGGITWITNTDALEGNPSPNPRMPEIRARAMPLAETQSDVTWELQIDYTRSHRDDHTTYGPQALSANDNWEAQTLFGNQFRGGQAMIKATMPALGNKTLKYVFAIRGQNPPEQVAINYIGTTRWYDRWIAAWEGENQNGRKYNQFNEVGAPGNLSTSSQFTPNWGDDGPEQPGGFGMFQLTKYGTPQILPTSQDLWNWQSNVDTAKNVVIPEKVGIATSYMNTQRQQAGGVPVPVEVVEAITFADGTSITIEDAVAIKAYNGASAPPGSGLPGHYCDWVAGLGWVFGRLNIHGENYVQHVCHEVVP